jgi:hypothetical protein
MKNFISFFFYVLQIQSNIDFISEKLEFKSNTIIKGNYYQSNKITITNLNSFGTIYLNGRIKTKQLSIGNLEEPNLIFFYNLPITETLKKSLLIDSSTGQIFQSENNNILEKKYINTTDGVYNTVATNNIQPQSSEDIIIANENNLKEKITIFVEAQEIDINANTIYLDVICSQQGTIFFTKPIEIKGILNCQEAINSKEAINSNIITCNTKSPIIINTSKAYITNINTPEKTIITTKNCSVKKTPSILFINNLPIMNDGNYLSEENQTIFQSKKTNTALMFSITDKLEIENITTNNATFPNIKNAKNITISNLYLETWNNYNDIAYPNSQINIFANNMSQYNIGNLSFRTQRIIGPNLYIKNITNDFLTSVNLVSNTNFCTTSILDSMLVKNFSIEVNFRQGPLGTFTHFIVFTNTKLPGTETNIAMLSKKTSASYLEKKNTTLIKETKEKIHHPIELLSLVIKIYELLEKKKKHIAIMKKKISKLKLLIHKKNYFKNQDKHVG